MGRQVGRECKLCPPHPPHPNAGTCSVLTMDNDLPSCEHTAISPQYNSVAKRVKVSSMKSTPTLDSIGYSTIARRRGRTTSLGILLPNQQLGWASHASQKSGGPRRAETVSATLKIPTKRTLGPCKLSKDDINTFLVLSPSSSLTLKRSQSDLDLFKEFRSHKSLQFVC